MTYDRNVTRTVAERIRRTRRKKGIPQADLAEWVGYNHNGAISRIESGENAPSLEKLIRIADELEVTTDYLLGRTP